MTLLRCRSPPVTNGAGRLFGAAPIARVVVDVTARAQPSACMLRNFMPMKQPSGAETCSWEGKKRCRNRTTSIPRLSFPCICTFATLHAQVQDGERSSKGSPIGRQAEVRRFECGGGRAGRGCAAGSSSGAIRRQPNNVFNVNSPGPPECGCHVCGQRHSSSFLPRKFHVVFRNSEETQQVGFSIDRVFRHADSWAWRFGMRWRGLPPNPR